MYEKKPIKIAKPINFGEKKKRVRFFDWIHFIIPWVLLHIRLCGHKMKWIIKKCGNMSNVSENTLSSGINTWHSDQLSRNEYDRLVGMYSVKKTCTATHIKQSSRHKERRLNRFQSKLLISLTIWLKFRRWWWSNKFFLDYDDDVWNRPEALGHCRNWLRITKLKPNQNKSMYTNQEGRNR